MNASLLLKRLKMKLGLTEFKLPVSDESMIDVIKTETLFTFSQFYPYIINYQLDTSKPSQQLSSQFQQPSEVFILKPHGDLKIYDVQNVYLNNDLFAGGFGNIGLNSFGMIEAMASNNLNQLENIPITWEFRQPNILIVPRLNFLNFESVCVVLACEHPDNLTTIPNDLGECFQDLAKLDLEIFLYNTLKRYNNLDTTFGSIDLKIDDWSNAESERKDWVESARRSFNCNQTRLFWTC